MPTLFLPWLGSKKHETCFRSDCDAKRAESSLAGAVLAGRFKILKKIDVHRFKAHDLLLDQTVMVRQAVPASQHVGDIWRQKVQALALVRDPNFLNILDMVSDKSRHFVITEAPQGQSIADLLKERSRFDVDDVLALVTPLAGALDLAASLHAARTRFLLAGSSPRRGTLLRLMPNSVSPPNGPHTSSRWTYGIS